MRVPLLVLVLVLVLALAWSSWGAGLGDLTGEAGPVDDGFGNTMPMPILIGAAC
jgi:hypothetical protein